MAPVCSFVILILWALHGVLSHPGHNSDEAISRAVFMKRSPKSVRSCASQLSRRGHRDRAVQRRRDMTAHARTKLGLPILARRDFASYNFSHASTKNFTFGDDEAALFTDNSSCILEPEVTQGPYWVDGELIRSNVAETQEGVPLFLDIQLIDTSSCKPVPAAYVDIWHCNATGVYSGVSASGNGDSNDTSNIDATFLRGIQSTDSNGVVQFETIFPGHYSGRATHIHVLSHNINETVVRTNRTIVGTNFTTSASHVGQIFFDQSLITEVETLSPYSTNDQEVTTNDDDEILASEADVTDPFAEYIMLGDSIRDGLLAWVSIGIDPTTDDTITSAATHYKNGGVANTDSSMGPASGGSGGPSSNSSEAPPS